jgi:hypothetical protein
VLGAGNTNTGEEVMEYEFKGYGRAAEAAAFGRQYVPVEQDAAQDMFLAGWDACARQIVHTMCEQGLLQVTAAAVERFAGTRRPLSHKEFEVVPQFSDGSSE